MARSDTRPGSYTLADSPEIQRRQDASYPAGSQWPELRIARFVSLDVDNCYDWTMALNAMGRANYGKGRERGVGSMALTIVEATQMGRMMSAKNPHLFDGVSRSRSIQYMRGIMKDYNLFVRESSREVVNKTNDVVNCRAGDDAMLPTPGLWGHVRLEVSRLQRDFGTNEVGLVFEDPEVIQEEFDATRRYLRSEGFNADAMNKGDRPHVSFFDTFAPVGRVALVPLEAPYTIDIDSPQMFFNSNSPHSI